MCIRDSCLRKKSPITDIYIYIVQGIHKGYRSVTSLGARREQRSNRKRPYGRLNSPAGSRLMQRRPPKTIVASRKRRFMHHDAALHAAETALRATTASQRVPMEKKGRFGGRVGGRVGSCMRKGGRVRVCEKRMETCSVAVPCLWVQPGVCSWASAESVLTG